MTKSTTERKSYHFKITEFGDGTPWIMLEPRDGNLAPFKNGFLGFDFREGITFEEAKEFARLMNEYLGDTAYTQFTD